jgi:hypothetical protein
LVCLPAHWCGRSWLEAPAQRILCLCPAGGNGMLAGSKRARRKLAPTHCHTTLSASRCHCSKGPSQRQLDMEVVTSIAGSTQQALAN